VVVTCVDRDDLRDGCAGHFADCIVPSARLAGHPDRGAGADFRGRLGSGTAEPASHTAER